MVNAEVIYTFIQYCERKVHYHPCKGVGGVEKINFDAREGRKVGMTEGQNDGQRKH